MAEAFIPLEDAAVYEDVKYNTLVQRIKRNPSGFKIKTESEGAGKDRILIGLSSLSRQGRSAYKAAQKIETESGSDIVLENTAGDAPWYVSIDLEWYMEKYKKQYYEAVELSNHIRTFLDYGEAEKTEFSKAFAEENDLSQRTLYRYSESYLQASAWALKMSKLDGENYDFFKILSLCRKPRDTGTFPSISDEVKAFIENIWFDKHFAANNPTVEMLFQKLKQVSQERDWDCPSYKTLARYVNYLMQDNGAGNAHFLAANGSREYKNKKMVKGSRDTGALPVMGMVQGDEHTFDCWVAYKHANGKVSAIKPKLVAWLDMRSRVIMGDIICRDGNSQILKLSLLKMIYSSPGGVPQWLLIDNGKDYTSKEMTGRKRSERRSDLCFDAADVGFYKGIGIQDDLRSIPYQPWSKAQIERFFGTVCKMFTRWMDSYTGTLTASKTAAKVKKDVPGMMERNELLTMDEFYEKWSEWKDTVYHRREHSGLKKQKEAYKTPIECFLNAENRYFKAAPPRSYATILMMKEERVHVYNTGIHRFDHEYRSDELVDYIGKKVSVRWDPDDVTRLYVYTLEGKKICEAISHELLLIAPKVPQKALEEHLKMQKRQLRKDQERLKYFTTPYEERFAQVDTRTGEVVGTIDLMVTGSGKPDKVVSMVRDEQYAQELKDGKSRRKPGQNQESEFLNRKANEALEKLRAINM